MKKNYEAPSMNKIGTVDQVTKTYGWFYTPMGGGHKGGGGGGYDYCCWGNCKTS